jgi:hypothetical protein
MTDNLSPDQAHATLDQAAQSAQRVRAQAQWMSIYLGAFAAGFAALTLVLGFVKPLPLAMVVAGVIWALMLTVMLPWAAQRRATLRGTGRRITGYWIASAVLFIPAMLIGANRLIDNSLYWVVAALVVAAPLAIGALRERRA